TADKKVLNNVSLKVDRGEIALLLGPSGVGKSTLLRILNDLESYDQGTLMLNGQKLEEYKLKNKHATGMIFQQFNLFEHMSVEKNITFVLEKSARKTPQEAHEIATHLLQKFGLESKAKLPISKLSGGQKQRLAIARSIALKPLVICFDEPTSALDPYLKSFVAQNIQELADEKYIVLVATHDISLIEKLKCTIYLMEQGKIIESSASAEFLAHPNQYPLINNFVKGAIMRSDTQT
ncbi:unnamed protein product, partial [Didymodactylos carnosus]